MEFSRIARIRALEPALPGNRSRAVAVPSSKRAQAGASEDRNGSPSPLSVVYALVGLEAPQATTIAPSRIPFPYRGLLTHEGNMTMTLEAHFGGPVALRALCAFRDGPSYLRRVVLVQKRLGRPVVMGAIRIDLDAFHPHLRRQILASRIPLGRLLRNGDVDYKSRPHQFFKVTPNSEMMAVFWMPKPQSLYGRQTELSLGGRKVGDIVEILPRV